MANYVRIDELNVIIKAKAGDRVEVEVVVKNLAMYGIYAYIYGEANGLEMWFGGEQWIGQWYKATFTDSFIMPAHDVRVHVTSRYLAGDGNWYNDDHAYANVALEEVVEEFRGTLSRKELEYDESRARIPVY